jgi:hypothetical protein
VAFVLIGLAMLALVADGLRAVRDGRTPEDRLAACALLSTVVVLLVVGAFDAVLLLPVPALIAWSLLGALSPQARERSAVTLPVWKRALALAGIALLGGLAVARSATQLQAMAVFSTTTRTARLEQASALDPGSYRIHLRLAQNYLLRGNCKKVISHATAAQELFPNAQKPKRLRAQCSP